MKTSAASKKISEKEEPKPLDTHYAALEAHRRMTRAELQSCWRWLSRILHPDRHEGTAEANAAFARITVAWGILKDPEARKRYDRGLEIRHSPCKTCKGEGRWLAKQIGFSRREWSRCAECGGCGFTEKRQPGRPRKEHS